MTDSGGAPRIFHRRRRRGFMVGGGGARPDERALKQLAHSLDRRFFLVLQGSATRGVVPLRHLRHVPPPPDSVATLVNSLQNRVKSITPCVYFERKHWENSPCDSMY